MMPVRVLGEAAAVLLLAVLGLRRRTAEPSAPAAAVLLLAVLGLAWGQGALPRAGEGAEDRAAAWDPSGCLPVEEVAISSPLPYSLWLHTAAKGVPVEFTVIAAAQDPRWELLITVDGWATPAGPGTPIVNMTYSYPLLWKAVEPGEDHPGLDDYHLVEVAVICKAGESAGGGGPVQLEDLPIVASAPAVPFIFVAHSRSGQPNDGVRPPERERRRYYLSAAAIFRDEAPFLREWLEFHLCAGVEHFFLYNHHSTDNYTEVLAPYLTADIVTLRAAPEPEYEAGGELAVSAQKLAYRSALREFGGDTQWLALIDVDEFLWAPGGEGGEGGGLADLLPAYEDFAALLAPWVLFGSGGLEETPEGLLIEGLLHREAWGGDKGVHFKAILQPKFVVHVSCHNHEYLPGTFAVTANYAPIAPNVSVNHDPTKWPLDVVRINHYRSKSLRHMRARAARNVMQDSMLREDDRFVAGGVGSLESQVRWELAMDEGLNAVRESSPPRLAGCVRQGLACRAGEAGWRAGADTAGTCRIGV